MKRRAAVFAICAACALSLAVSCDDAKKHEVLFSYNKILKKEFTFDVGKSVPVTIEQTIETDGVFTRDGQYVFFASDRERGNFDIYCRSLTDIATVRVTSHPSRDTSPAISHNGKYCAFVSQREDPEGDIYVMKIDPKKMIAEGSSPETLRSYDADAVNLTQMKDPSSGTVLIIKDGSPAWSPDGKTIAFSSMRGGAENIWLMDRRGKNMRQITHGGGLYPRFSEDGKKIVFISYRDEGSNGDIYIVDLATGSEKRITATPDIELAPTFLENSDELVYTRINIDTDGDGHVSLKDNSVLYYKNLRTGLAYPLTLYGVSSFSPQWSPVYGGIIVYSEQSGRNINVNIIPDDGVIPKRENARRQYELAEKYLKEFDDQERYLLALERVHHFFGAARDSESVVFTAKALADAAKSYRSAGKGPDALRCIHILSEISSGDDDYRRIMSRYLTEIVNGRQGESVLSEALERVLRKNGKSEIIPYLLEDRGDEFSRHGRMADAVADYRVVLLRYPEYKRAMYVQYKLAGFEYTTLRQEVPQSVLAVLESSFIYLKNDTIVRLLDVFEREGDTAKRLSAARDMQVRYRDNKYLPGLLHYVIGKCLYERGDTDGAQRHCLEALTTVKKTDVVYYRASILLGDIARAGRRNEDFEKYYAAAANNYLLFWKQADIRTVIGRLIDYYEEYGERAEYSGRYSEAVDLYKKYVWMLTYLHLKKRFEDIYNEYGARAHVLYIDAYSSWKGDDFEGLSKIQGDYMQRLPIARMDFDKAHIYGLGYLYSKMALALEGAPVAGSSGLVKGGTDGLLGYFKKGVDQLDWALFIDDTFIDAYILKGWIYQYVDLRRSDDARETGGKNEGLFGRFFPRYLWESNIAMYEKALDLNDEAMNQGKEGDLHLNIGNTYFLLTNYPRALFHYAQAERFKKGFGSRIEEALFHYHYGYCWWQQGRNDKARSEMAKTLYIYQTLGSGKNARMYKNQMLSLYRFFALLHRDDGNYSEALAWYTTILEFAAVNRIHVDRARYLQEIAFCYKEMGETVKALVYLDKAETLLKKYSDAEKKHYLKVKIFGFGPIPLMNLGPDVAVIGDNRLYAGLDTANKKLLNISLQEKVFFSRKDYARSIERLKEKVGILKKRSSRFDQDGRIRTLNNIGYCYVRLGDYTAAQRYFSEAWEYAADPKVNDLDGIFASIVNTVNLYACRIENGDRLPETPRAEIDALMKRIGSYRDGYEADRFAKEFAAMKEDARLRKRSITEAEEAELREKISRDAARIYSALDIAAGVLEYYKAEMRAGSTPGGSAPNAGDPYAYYRTNSAMYGLYSDALRRFEGARAGLDAAHSQRAAVKLLLNIGSCYERLGRFDEAYQAFAGAEKKTRQYRYHDLQWIVDHTIAGFLAAHGEFVEGAEYRSLAAGHYRAALDDIEKYPALYADGLARVKRLYNGYVDLLLSDRNWKAALTVLEKKYETTRIMSIALASPELYRDEDNAAFREYSARLNAIDRTYRDISAALENGAAPLSEKIAALDDVLKKEKTLLDESIGRVMVARPLTASLMRPVEYGIAGVKNAEIIRMHRSGEKVYAWRIAGGTVEFAEVTRKGEETACEAAARYCDGVKPGAAARRFIVLDELTIDMMRHVPAGAVLPPFTFTPSVERVRYFSGRGENAVSSIGYSGRGLKPLISAGGLAGMPVYEGKLNEAMLPLYSIVIDDAGDVTPLLLFKSSIRPYVIIGNMRGADIDDARMCIEASLYAGARSLVLAEALSPNIAADIVRRMESEPLDRLQSGVDSAHGVIVAVGDCGTPLGTLLRNRRAMKDKAYESFKEEYAHGNIYDARMYLSRWRDLSEDDARVPLLYLLHDAEMNMLEEQYVKATASLDTAIGLSTGVYDDLFMQSVLMKLYVLLYNGDIESAAGIMARHENNTKITSSGDWCVFKAVITMAREGVQQSAGFAACAANTWHATPPLRLALLYAEYAALLGDRQAARAAFAGVPVNCPLSPREACKLAALGGPGAGLPQHGARVREIMKLTETREGADGAFRGAMTLVENDGRYDSLSAYPVSWAVDVLVRENRLAAIRPMLSNIDADEVYRNASWLDAVPLLMELQRLYGADGRYGEALNILQAAHTGIGNKALPALRREYYYQLGMLYRQLGKYHDSYEAAMKGASLVPPTDAERYLQYQLLLMEDEILLGRIDEADVRGTGVQTGGRDEYEFMLSMLKSRIALARILKKKTATDDDWGAVTTLIHKGVDSLDRSPDVLSRCGRIDLAEQGIDFLISFTMSRNAYLEALTWAEVKKQLQLRAKFFTPTMADALPGDVIREFKSIRDRRTGGGRFVDLLRKYPRLQAGALAATIPVELFQKRIPDSAMVFYLVRNGNDILAWVIAKQFIEPMRLKNGYARCAEALERHRQSAAGFSGAAAMSNELYGIFRPLEKYYSGRDMLVFVTDRDLEQVPFEIIGARDMLEESHTIVYLSSILSSFREYPEESAALTVVDSPQRRMHQDIEMIAIRQSGIPCSMNGNVSGKIGHIFKAVAYNPLSRELRVGGERFDMLSGSAMLYLSDVESAAVTGLGNAAMLGSMYGIGGIIVNGAEIQDINSAVFAGALYAAVRGGEGYIRAFSSAKSALRGKARFRYPAYWSGIRLYTNGL